MGRRNENGYCPECKQETEILVDESQGHCVCTQCGLVVENQFIDEAHDVRIFEDNQNAQRIETAKQPEDGQAGEIASITFKGNVKGRGRGRGGNNNLSRRAAGESSRKKPVVPESHVEKIEEYASAVNLTGVVVQRAQEIYKEFAEGGGYIKGKNAPGLQVGCIYIAARQMGHMKMMKDLEMNTNVSVPEIRRGDIKIRRGAPSAVPRDLVNRTNFNYTTPEETAGGSGSDSDSAGGERPSHQDDYAKASVDRVCSALKFNFRERKCAQEMAYAVGKKGLGGSMQPASIAGAIAWTCSLLFGRDDNIKDIVTHSVGKVTIRKAYKLLQPHFTSIIPTDIFGDPQDWQKKLKRP